MVQNAKNLLKFFKNPVRILQESSLNSAGILFGFCKNLFQILQESCSRFCKVSIPEFPRILLEFCNNFVWILCKSCSNPVRILFGFFKNPAKILWEWNSLKSKTKKDLFYEHGVLKQSKRPLSTFWTIWPNMACYDNSVISCTWGKNQVQQSLLEFPSHFTSHYSVQQCC